jgi:predicted HD phosphohydrolase
MSNDFVLLQVALPHWHELRWTDDQGVVAVILLHDSGDGCSHQGFPKPYDVAEQHAPVTVELLCRKQHRCFLKVQEHIAKDRRHLELAFTLARIL